MWMNKGGPNVVLFRRVIDGDSGQERAIVNIGSTNDACNRGGLLLVTFKTGWSGEHVPVDGPEKPYAARGFR